MASNPPGKCCFTGFYHEGKHFGSFKEVYGVETYVTEETCHSRKDFIIVILTDIFGIKLNNSLLVADQLSKGCKAKVYIPDILFNDPVIDLNGNTDFQDWLNRHPAEKVKQLVENFIKDIRANEPGVKNIAVVGYCYGAKFAIQQISNIDGQADICAIAHPSFVNMEELSQIDIKRPLLISAADNDDIFTDELRHKSILKLKEINAIWQLDLFSGTTHGFAARGDIRIPSIKYAKEKALSDQIYWFNHFIQ